MRPCRVLLLLVSALMLVGCVTRTATIPEAESVQASSYAPLAEGPYRLDSGDRLRVVVFGQDGLTTSYAVDSAGSITMPLIGPVPASGKTTQELARLIEQRLRSNYLREPKVTVEIDTYRPFFILGEVVNSGQYPFVSGMTVQTAIAIAGGFTPRANQNEAQVTRQQDGKVIIGTVPITYPVQPGDTILVKERWF